MAKIKTNKVQRQFKKVISAENQPAVQNESDDSSNAKQERGDHVPLKKKLFTQPDTLGTEIAEELKGNEKWALQFQQILAEEQPKGKKSLILSKVKRNKKDEDTKTQIGFEIEGEIKDEKPDKDELEAQLEKKRIKASSLNLRVKPKQMDVEREKGLKKVATKGVVQLFNAVRTQQKDLKRKLDEVGPLDHRKDAVLNNINKKKFLDVLMGGSRAKSEMIDNPIKDEEIKEESDDEDNHQSSQWSVLR